MVDLCHLRKVPGLNGGSLLLFITLTLISTTSCTVNVKYLRGVPRLSNTSYWDYYFSCNTVGASPLWEVNGTGLNEFQGVNIVGQVLAGTLPSYTYTATLLSSKPTTGGQFTFDSILIVSQAEISSLDVVCSNGTSSSRTSNMDNGKGVESCTSTSSIFEEYLLTEDIVGDQINPTSIFICGVQNTILYWRTGTSSELGFGAFNNIGQEKRNVENSATTVMEQAILIAKEPYLIVSVFLVTATSDVTVTCGDDNQTEVSLTSRYNSSTSVPTVQTDPEIVSSTTLGTSTGGGTEITTSNSLTDTITTSESSTLMSIVIGVVIPVVLVVYIVVQIVAYFIYNHVKKRKQQPQPKTQVKYVQERSKEGVELEPIPLEEGSNKGSNRSRASSKSSYNRSRASSKGSYMSLPEEDSTTL